MGYVRDVFKGNLLHEHPFGDIEGGTSTQVVYFDANGKLTSSANLTFNGTQLVSVGNILTPILYGSSAANGNLVIEGTSNATKTTSYVLLQTSPSAGSVGIGTSSPTAKLHITNTGSGDSFRVEDSASTDATPFVIDDIGNVGIGVAAPTRKVDIFSGGVNIALRVQSSATASPTSGGGGMLLGTTTALSSGDMVGFFLFVDSAGSGNVSGMTSKRDGNGADLRFETNAGSARTERLKITGAGNIGLGVDTPTSVLHIKAGTATAGTAPLKFSAGVLNTTQELGAMEFTDDGTDGKLYITLNIGGVLTRKEIALV